MPRLVVRIVVTRADEGDDATLIKVKSDDYSPDHLESLINVCLSKGLEAAGGDIHLLRSWTPELSVLLSSESDESMRPSLHLGINTIQRLAEIGASFDFDPYV